MKKIAFLFFRVLFITLLVSALIPAKAAVINYDITTAPLVIPAGSTDDYYIEGKSTTTTNTINVESGYHGTITLDNVRIRAAANYAAIRVKGLNNGDVLNPVTKVTFILKGYNQLETGAGPDPKGATVTTVSDAAAFQVDQGSQIHICAIDEQDDTSGELVARCYHNSDGGAGIGGTDSNGGTIAGDAGSQGTVSSWGPAQTGTMHTSGGNIIISSGKIFARGGRCGAGIGSGYRTIFMGNIVIYGGDVTAYGGDHSAGIGTGCPAGSGNNGWYSFASSIIVLPPAKIVATTEQSGKLGLAGANSITYVGDPQSPLVTVQTEDMEKDADIYADLSETTSVVTIFEALGITKDRTSIKFGNTGDSGQLQFKANFAQNITFFTDASSTNPATQGRPYKPVTTTVTAAKTISLPLLQIGMSLEAIPATPLEVGYSTAQAKTNAYRLKVTYTDSKPLTGISFDLQSGTATNFKGLTFYNADGVTERQAPVSLNNGDVFYVQVPLKDGLPLNIYKDVLRISGTFDGAPTGFIRQVITQRVVVDDTDTNNYIKVTATPATFTTNNAATATATLNLSITHGSQAVLYNNLDVTARYLITTEPDYDLAIAATPLTGWTSLNVPASDGGSATTTASFTGKPENTYYIHWYVESGVVYAHSKTVVSPTATYGGFGPYIIDISGPATTLRVDNEQATKSITAHTALPVTMTFSETIKNPLTDLTVADFEILPNSIATLSNITVVANSGNAIFEAILTPQPALYNGQSFTIRLKDATVTDLAGNNNTASNTVTLLFENDTKPAVAFKNSPTYSSLRPTFTVEVLSGDFGLNANTDLYQTAGGPAIIAGANLSSLFTITPQGGAPLATTAYTAVYSKTGSGATAKGVVTFTFTNDLINSTNYTIALATDRLYNKLQNGNNAGQSTFLITQPDFTGGTSGISADPNLFGSTGGTTTLTILGKGLTVNAENGILSLRVTCPAIGYNSGNISTGFVTDATEMDVVTIHNVPIPANTGISTLSHTFELFLTFNGNPEISTGKTCVVLVEPDASHIIGVKNTTASTTDLTYGYSTGQAQLAGSRQNITVTNNGAQILNDLTVTLIGTDGSMFTNTLPAPATGLAPGNTATFYVYLQTGKNAGSYAGDAETKVMVSATQETAVTPVSGSDFIVAQVVNPKASTNNGLEGSVVGNPAPSTTWSNQPTVDLTASALETGDVVKEWKYAVSSVNMAPGPMDPAWTTINGGKTTATYTFPAGTDGSRYIFWQMNTNNINGITGQVQNSGVYVYNIDLVAPAVTNIVPERTITNATPFKVTVIFSEPVSMADASKFTATNATVGTPTAVGTPANGLYTTYEMTLTPNAGLTMGSTIVFSVKADAVKDKANNNNPAGVYDVGISYNNVNPIITLTTPDPTVNSNFVVTITFSKAVTGLTESDLMIINGAVSAGSLNGSGTTYTVTINTAASSSGYIGISVPDNAAVDAANNGNEAGGLAVDYRKPADRIAAVLTYAGPTYENGAFDVRVNFSRNITGLTAADFAYNTADFAAPVLTGGGKNYVLTLTPLVNKDATTNVQLPAGIPARDEYGNELIASNSVSVNYDTRQPLVTSIITEGGITTTHFDPFTVTIVFDEPNLHSFDAGKLLLTHLDYLGLVSGPVTNGSTTQVKISVKVAANTPSRSTLTLTAGEGTAQDKANNPNKAGAGAIPLDIQFVDNEPPHVINITPSNDWASVAEGNVIFTLDEPINPASNGSVWLEDFGYIDGVWINSYTYSVPYGRLANDQVYTVYISGYKDPEGNIMVPASASFGTQALIFPEIMRPVVIIANDGLVTNPEAEKTIYINSQNDFIFEVSAPQGNPEYISVKTGSDIRDKEGVKTVKNKDGSFTVTVVQVTESLAITVSLSPTANETIGSDNIWAHDHTLYVQTDQPGTLFVYTMAGVLYKQVRIEDHQTAIPLEAGFYTVVFNGTSHIVVIK